MICPECKDYVAGPLVRDCKVCGGMGFIRDEDLFEGPNGEKYVNLGDALRARIGQPPLNPPVENK